MAPNRKNVSNLLQTLSSSDLESLQQSVQPKYLPLTHPTEEAKHLQQQQIEASNSQTTSASYWDWPTEDIKEVEEPVVVVDLFSASRIEANLIKAAAAAAAAEAETESSNKTVAENDDYWAEAEQDVPEEEKEVIRAPQHVANVNYWEWPSDDEKSVRVTTIRRILSDEQARIQTTALSMERSEASSKAQTTAVQQVASQKQSNDQYWQWDSTKVASHVADPSHPNANYWDWESSTSNTKPSSMIQSIMEYEAARELLMASTIVQQLQSSSSCANTATNTKASSDDYWNFSEQYGDEYWQGERHTPAAVTAGSNNAAGYWDW